MRDVLSRALCMQDVLSRALFMHTPRILWETPEVTTAAKAACQPASELPEPPLRHCRNLQFTAAPTGSGVSGGRALRMQDVLSRALFRQTQQILWETPEVTTAAKAACQSASNCLNHRLATVVTSSNSTGSGVSGGRALCMRDVLSRALFMQTQHILWETPEVTTAAKAACQSASNFLTHRLRHCRNLQQLPQGPGCLDVGRCACRMFDLLTDPPYSRASSLHIRTRQSLITGAAVRTQLVGTSSIAFA